MLGFILHLIKIMPISDGMMYELPPLAIAGIAMGGAQVLTGGLQALFSGRRRKEPKYEIPKEIPQYVKETYDFASQLSQMGTPQPTLQMQQQNALASAVFGLRNAQDRRAGLSAIGNIQAGLDRTNLQIAAQDASMRQQNMLTAQRLREKALLTSAQYQDKAFSNIWQSWANREQQRIETRNAGFQNIARGIGTAGTMFGQAY